MSAKSKPGRNDPCPCGSGKKWKQCCGAATAAAGGASSSLAAAAPLVRQAQELLRARRYGEAVAPLTRAATLSPGDPELLHDLGMACLLARRLPDAVLWLRRAAALRPDSARVHGALGTALQQSGDDAGALASYGKAVALSPGQADVHARIADLLLRQGRRTEAGAAYARAAAAASGTTFGLLSRAKALTVEGRATEAEAPLRELVAREEQDPSRGEAHLMLGNILSESGRFTEAAEELERSLALAPWQATAHHALVSLRRLGEGDRPLLARILARLQDRDVAPRQAMTLHFAAGKAKDDLEDYEGAMAHFDAANQLRHRLYPLDRAAFPEQVDALIAQYTPDLFAKRGDLGVPDETPLLVLGMPRSGTTLTERILSAHPKARGGGELVFWNEHAPAVVHADLAKLGEAAASLQADYLALLHRIGPGAARVTDKMPGNFLWIGLVHLLFPNARFVHCRRNPVDTCLSLYTTDITGNWGFASDRSDLVWYYRHYARLMEHWRRVLPEARFLEVDYEKVTAAPEEEARRLVAFAGLDWDPACLSPEQNSDAVRTANKWQARQPVFRSSVERWRKYEPWLGELRELLPGDTTQGPSG